MTSSWIKRSAEAHSSSQSLEAQVLLDRIQKLTLDEAEEGEEVQTRYRDHLPNSYTSGTHARTMSQSVVSRLVQAEIQGSNTPVSKLTVAVDILQSVRERLATLSGGVFRLPLPADVDPEFSIRIAVGGVHGFQLSHCAKTIEDADGDPTGAADATILEVVDKANLVLDTLYPAMNVGKVIVQRGMLHAEDTQTTLRVVKEAPKDRLTLGHLLTYVVREHYSHERKMSLKAKGLRGDTSYTGRKRGQTPQLKNLYIVAIRRAQAYGHPARWIPELEVHY